MNHAEPISSLQILLCGLAVLIVLTGGCQPDRSSTSPPPGSSGKAATGTTNPASTSASKAAPVGEEQLAAAPPASKPIADTSSSPPSPKPLTDEELADGWISLFDGETFFGWQPTSPADWKIQDGVIVVTSGEPGLLCTTSQFADYVLKLDFRFAAGTNSGVFLHSPLKPADPAKDCYELNIAEPEVSPFSTGSFVKRAKADAQAAPGTWHSYEVTVEGGHLVVKLDDQQVLDYTDPEPLRRGYIGLQLNKGQVEFRHIKLKPLGLSSLFNGKDLAGWKEYPQMKSKFTVTAAGELNVQDGRGQLESATQFGDFVLQIEAISHAPQLNSGLFFRCLPGQEMNGYESQIHNGFRDNDRRKPVDCGTGGIFRRQDARLVVPDDLQWFHMTIVADGAHVSVWVNGYQVTDWTDDRAPDENPRKGLRTAAGTIMLQGHDPTTNLSFRHIRAVELAKRAVQ